MYFVESIFKHKTNNYLRHHAKIRFEAERAKGSQKKNR